MVQADEHPLTQTRPDTLASAARVYWKSFAPLWVWPLVFQLAVAGGQRTGHLFLSWWLVAFPFGCWAFFRASRLWLAHAIRFTHQFVLGMVIPLVVLTIVMFLFNSSF
jgi:hypothetical protein